MGSWVERWKTSVSWWYSLNLQIPLKHFVPLEFPVSRSDTFSIFAGSGLSWASVPYHQNTIILPSLQLLRPLRHFILKQKNLEDFVSNTMGNTKSGRPRMLNQNTKPQVKFHSWSLGQKHPWPWAICLLPLISVLPDSVLAAGFSQNISLTAFAFHCLCKQQKQTKTRIEWKKKYPYTESQQYFIQFLQKIGIILFLVFWPFYSYFILFFDWWI